jgi:hypothetical protein
VLTATGFWTANHLLVLLNAVLALATVAAVGVSITVARAANRQATATDNTVKATNDQLILGRDQLEQEREALLASVRPLVVDVPLGAFVDYRTAQEIDQGAVRSLLGGDGSIILHVPIRNVGVGPAFLRTAMLLPRPGTILIATTTGNVLPTNELGAVDILASVSDEAFPIVKASRLAGSLVIAVDYADLGGQQRTRTLLHLGQTSNETAPVTQVQLFRCDEKWVRESEPIVSTGTYQPLGEVSE